MSARRDASGVVQGRGECTTCASTAFSLKLCRANARRPLTHWQQLPQLPSPRTALHHCWSFSCSLAVLPPPSHDQTANSTGSLQPPRTEEHYVVFNTPRRRPSHSPMLEVNCHTPLSSLRRSQPLSIDISCPSENLHQVFISLITQASPLSLR
jgi:hypothetical protein